MNEWLMEKSLNPKQVLTETGVYCVWAENNRFQPGMAIPVAHRDAWAKIEWTPAMVQAHVRSGL